MSGKFKIRLKGESEVIKPRVTKPKVVEDKGTGKDSSDTVVSKTRRMSVADLRRLFKDEESRKFPPDLNLWKKILQIVDNKPDEDEFEKVQAQLRYSVQRYKPSLPEPTVVKFLHQGKYYFLDPMGKIFKINDKHPLTGDLVGKIEGSQVYIDDQCVKELDNHQVEHKVMYDKDFYVSGDKVFEGLHPSMGLIYHVGQMDSNGRKYIPLLH